MLILWVESSPCKLNLLIQVQSGLQVLFALQSEQRHLNTDTGKQSYTSPKCLEKAKFIKHLLITGLIRIHWWMSYQLTRLSISLINLTECVTPKTQ